MISDKDILNNLTYENTDGGTAWCVPGSLFPDNKPLKVIFPTSDRRNVMRFLETVREQYRVREQKEVRGPSGGDGGGSFDFEDLQSAESKRPRQVPSNQSSDVVPDKERHRDVSGFPEKPGLTQGLDMSDYLGSISEETVKAPEPISEYLTKRVPFLRNRREALSTLIADATRRISVIDEELKDIILLLSLKEEHGKKDESRGQKISDDSVASGGSVAEAIKVGGDGTVPKKRGRPPKQRTVSQGTDNSATKEGAL